MNDAQLADIRKRSETATPGPWTCDPDPAYAHLGANGYLLTVGPVWALGYTALDMKMGDPDAAFITHAREDVPALLAEIEALRTVVREVGRRAPNFDTVTRSVLDGHPNPTLVTTWRLFDVYSGDLGVVHHRTREDAERALEEYRRGRG